MEAIAGQMGRRGLDLDARRNDAMVHPRPARWGLRPDVAQPQPVAGYDQKGPSVAD